MLAPCRLRRTRLSPARARRGWSDYTAEALPRPNRVREGVRAEPPSAFLRERRRAPELVDAVRFEELDALVEEALRANPDVHAAQAALRQALENTAAQRGSYFPTVQAGFDAQPPAERRGRARADT